MLAPGCQLVFGGGNRLAAVGALAVEIGDNAGQLAHRAGHGDAEHTLAALQQVDNFLGRRALVHRGAVGEQRDVGEILDATLAQMSTATRMLCSEIPVSSSRLTILRTRMSLNE